MIFDGAMRSASSDVWGFGTLMWEMFACGAVPFDGLSAEEIKDKVIVSAMMIAVLAHIGFSFCLVACWTRHNTVHTASID